jgi:hypothetical protein
MLRPISGTSNSDMEHRPLAQANSSPKQRKHNTALVPYFIASTRRSAVNFGVLQKAKF